MQRQAQRWRRQGVRVGFVPTMGYLHAGHISLMKRARQCVGAPGQVVVSIYVNPTQFGPKEDFARYPRNLARDRKLCRAAGVDVLFAPLDREMYPRDDAGDASTYVVEEKLARGMEGAARPAHFRGVTTVVAKLLNLVRPDVAVFGAKDYQQAAVIHRMVRDLHFPVQIKIAPTHRERDGLAMSSRNKYLSAEERRQALVLWAAIQLARRAVRAAPASAARLKRRVAQLIRTKPLARLDYVEFFAPVSLQPVRQVKRGDQMALAVFIGKTRLLDHGRLA
jgi:pantoate--beta-alanine ligase